MPQEPMTDAEYEREQEAYYEAVWGRRGEHPMTRIAALSAEVARLRVALEKIAGDRPLDYGEWDNPRGIDLFQWIARQALDLRETTNDPR